MERFLTNDRLIASYRNKLDVKAFPEDKLNMAYLDEKYAQFLKHLNEGTDEMVSKVLKEISNQLQDGADVYNYSLKQPLLLDKIFFYLQNHENDYIRELCSQCFKQFCKVLTTKEFLHEKGIIKQTSKSFDDKVVAVRLNVYQGLIYYAESRYGKDMLVENKINVAITKKLDEEKETKAVLLILTLMDEILRAEKAPQIALECNLVKILKKHLNSSDSKIKENVLLNYGSLSLCEEGKTACVAEGESFK